MVEAETGASDADSMMLKREENSTIAQEQRESDFTKRHKGKRKNKLWRSGTKGTAENGQEAQRASGRKRGRT